MMKKCLAIILTLTLISSSLLLFTSCKKVSEKDYTENPAKLLSLAMTNAGEEFFPSNSQLLSAVEEAMKGGSVGFSFESQLLGELEKISGTLYAGEEEQRAVLEALVRCDGQDMVGRLFLDREGLILSGRDILGSDTALGIFPEGLAEGFGTSALANMLCPDDASRAEMQEVLDALAESWSAALEEAEARYDFFNAQLTKLQAQLDTEKIDVNGKNEKCLTVTYTVDHVTLKDVVDALIAEYGEAATTPDGGSLSEEWEALYEELEARYAMQATLKLFINQKSATMAVVTVDATLTPKSADDGDVLSFTGEATFSETQIRIGGEINEGGEINGGALVLTKLSDSEGCSYVAEIEVREGDDTRVPVRLSTDFSKDSGDFSVELMVQESELSLRQTYRLKGNLSVGDKQATFSLNQLSLPAGISLDFNLTLSFNAEAAMPTAPEQVEDVVTMSAEELAEMINSINGSRLGQLIAIFQSGSVTPDL